MASYPREIRLEGRKAFEIVGWGKKVDIGQRRLHAARLRAVVAPADQRIEPDDPAAASTQAPHFLAKQFRLAGVIAIRDDHHRGARIDDPSRMPTIECGEALADLCAAADALRHQRELVDGAA